METNHPRAHLQSGISLIESLITLTIVSVVLGTVAPSLGTTLERRHLDGVAAQLETDIQFTRSQAVASNASMRMRFQTDAAGSCYVVHTGPANACICEPDGTATCTPAGQALRSVRFANGAAVQLQANVNSILFSHTLGTSTPTGTIKLTGREGRLVHLVVNLMGRVRACSPSGVPGYLAC